VLAAGGLLLGGRSEPLLAIVLGLSAQVAYLVRVPVDALRAAPPASLGDYAGGN
jgi:hypothetical protein